MVRTVLTLAERKQAVGEVEEKMCTNINDCPPIQEACGTPDGPPLQCPGNAGTKKNSLEYIKSFRTSEIISLLIIERA